MNKPLPLLLLCSAFLLASCGEGPSSSEPLPSTSEDSSLSNDSVESTSDPASSSEEESSEPSSILPQGGTLYIAPNGTSSGDGTEASPLSFIDGIKASKPGDTLYLLGGTYKSLSTLFVTKDKSH